MKGQARRGALTYPLDPHTIVARAETEGEKMTTVFVNHRVADYDAWRPHFDRAMEADWTKDVRSYQVWRGQDDPSHVVVANTFDSREAAEAMVSSPMLREAMAAAGVVESSVQIDYLDEVASETG
jgi:quinol monooxygenase YgiN